ncbi:calcium-binding protein [Mesorhizobium sp. M0496]|uniref:calcium-binding protein n=1 Tax=Mesorhizobium sp. M0496 TaxID=2956952 RepID=UPI00333CB891
MSRIIEGGRRPEPLIGTELGDWMEGSQYNDWIDGRGGDDKILGGNGNDRANGGEGNDDIFGGDGSDRLSGDNSRVHPRISGEDNDRLNGGPGEDDLYVGDGQDTLTGGTDSDTFVFQFHNPVPGVVGSKSDITTITDFNPAEDTFAFDAVGLYNDGFGANFVNNASLQSGSPVSSFYSGAASGANGEHVVVITGESFNSPNEAARAISGEHAGDIIVYQSSYTDRVATLAYVTAEGSAHEFAHLGGVVTVADLGLTASDFTFV